MTIEVSDNGIISFDISKDSSVWVFFHEEKGLVVSVAEDDSTFIEQVIDPANLYEVIYEQYNICGKIKNADLVKIIKQVKAFRKGIKNLERQLKVDLSMQLVNEEQDCAPIYDQHEFD